MTISFFTKQALGPTLSSYRDLGFEPSSLSSLLSIPTTKPYISSPNSTISIYIERIETSLQQILFPTHETESKTESADLENPSLEKVKCDLYKGTWVKDDDYPIYEPGSCPYVDEGFSCQSNGRRDSEYLKWRWKPHGCDLPMTYSTEIAHNVSTWKRKDIVEHAVQLDVVVTNKLARLRSQEDE
ncbi:hypothetical protein HHK36_007884 [Tetracentron sinense]|uniref:Trichome birefringence-like N-terminal domain-containing protein n=1 Tax=Tetracentron sinense TaxID=13715 RepID=A0A834ZFH0_TETSI|nr:hypothetical protein HHK36_007884 [Tetracentron sinense]